MPDCDYLKKLWDDLERKEPSRKKPKTIFFEERFGVDIREFRSMKDVDEFVERKLGRPLRIVDVSEHLRRYEVGDRRKTIIYGVLAAISFISAWFFMLISIYNDLHPIMIAGMFSYFASMELADRAESANRRYKKQCKERSTEYIPPKN